MLQETKIDESIPIRQLSVEGYTNTEMSIPNALRPIDI